MTFDQRDPHLTADQYLILEDGLLLITDDLAQASIDSLMMTGSHFILG